MDQEHGKLKITITEQHRAKICLDMICKFLNLIKTDLYNPEKTNMSVNDYTLKQFQQRIGVKIEEEDPYRKKKVKRDQ